MLLRFILKMFLLTVLLTNVLALPVDEFKKFIHEEGSPFNDEKYLMQIIPGINYAPQKSNKNTEIGLADIIGVENEYYKDFSTYVKNGFALKGLTFNIYDDNMRNAAIALFRLLQDVDTDQFHKILGWAKDNINKDLLTYAWKLAIIYSDKNKLTNSFEQEPPYIMKPNYFINGETIRKAMQLMIDDGQFNEQEAKVSQIYKTGSIITINTNYSGWNLGSNGCHEELNYFREDIGINSYYSGIQLLHPFWMSNNELEEINSRHAEYYYYNHKQLMARYDLEREYLKFYKNSSTGKCFTDYNPYLYYDNGLPFPIRSSTLKDWSEEQAKIKSIDIAIRECISRRVIFMDNGTKISMTEDNYIDLLAKILRANLDGIKSAKFIRSFFGYGGNNYPPNSYNPAPSVLHHPETSLRDPIYWYLIQNLLNYFNEFERTLEPYDMSKYEYSDVKIIDAKIPKITTYYSYYQLSLNKGLKKIEPMKLPYVVTARLKRLNHVNFKIGFTMESTMKQQVVVRLFLGPPCNFESCWVLFHSFFELDSFNYQFETGINTLTWSPFERFSKFSFENFYNMEENTSTTNRYNLFKFPITLLIPRGLEKGLNLTLFIIVTPAEESLQTNMPIDYYSNYQKSLPEELDKKPLGFPFHREASNYQPFANNYKFFNITIYHKEATVKNGFFSKHLY